ncbi:MAG: DUF2007 domain-containing protein [Dehalococcoidales bacterium]
MNNKEKLTEVYKARTEMEAQVIKGLLESFNIPCILKANAAPSVHMFTMNGLAQVKVMVLDSQADEARELIVSKNHV